MNVRTWEGPSSPYVLHQGLFFFKHKFQETVVVKYLFWYPLSIDETMQIDLCQVYCVLWAKGFIYFLRSYWFMGESEMCPGLASVKIKGIWSPYHMNQNKCRSGVKPRDSGKRRLVLHLRKPNEAFEQRAQLSVFFSPFFTGYWNSRSASTRDLAW